MPDALEISPLVSIFAAPFEFFVAFFSPSWRQDFQPPQAYPLMLLNRAVHREMFAVERRVRKNK